MAAYDSIVNVDEWISDHYLTNDETRGESFAKRAAAAVKEWKDQDKTAAPRSPWARLSAQREQLLKRLSLLDADNAASVADAADIVDEVSTRFTPPPAP